MAEAWFSLSRVDQVEALEFAAARSGRPAHLLEKDVWVVWTLSAIYESGLASKLTFKGGTSLSKVYRIIDRFSEDVDLTYWEKATAAHVYCLQGRLRGERYSRHWYDLAAVAKTPHFAAACADRALARAVAEHKSVFFVEKDAVGARIDYFAATSGQLQLIPTGESLAALENDYASHAGGWSAAAESAELCRYC